MRVMEPQFRSSDRRYYGVVEALVVEVNDRKKKDGLKYNFPWFDSDMTSDWCRVAQFYAGPGYGAFWTPEMRDEVLVAFIHGDMRQPIIIGGLYNGSDKPSTFRSDDKDEKLIRTKAGHQILLVDTKGEERIVITDKSQKHQIEISTKDNAVVITSTGGKLSLVAKEIEILADESLKIQAQKITEQAQNSFTLDAGKIDTTASGVMNLKGSTINLN